MFVTKVHFKGQSGNRKVTLTEPDVVELNMDHFRPGDALIIGSDGLEGN